jgi:hypothetical protein
MSSFIQALDDEDDAEVDDDEVVCNAVENCIDPPNYSAAMKTAAAEHWKNATEDELKSLRDNRTWVVVEKPSYVKPLASHFVFKLNTKRTCSLNSTITVCTYFGLRYNQQSFHAIMSDVIVPALPREV